ncbi:acetoacetate decarboxylase [Moesziomyces antarcticus]|uniref:Acetoacetate decarboxylase n=2 Tax=Pseudozyma antarctica TaxID=84753 RepID=A0A081CMV0_PSEA2|nr:acetoacetate decarboxylase [Moesziomyces antarcticus]GAK67996.1 acetoacetate decarboxylase [Moesziomyces antarcticus]
MAAISAALLGFPTLAEPHLDFSAPRITVPSSILYKPADPSQVFSKLLQSRLFSTMSTTRKGIHRAPIGFGPAPSPRQAPDGSRFDWSQARTTTVVVEVERECVEALLPPGYTVSDSVTHPTVLFEVMELRNLPWLAGRGYNTLGVYLNDIVCNRVQPAITASYMAVLFENFTDPITTGREELGFPKVYAEIPNAIVSQKEGVESRVHTLAWGGFEFLRLEMELTAYAVQNSPALKPDARRYTHPTKDGILHQRYVPAVGEPGKSDADYATFCPPPPGPPKVLEFKAPPLSRGGDEVCPAVVQVQPDQKAEGTHEFCEGAVKLSVKRGSFDQLPTLYNVVDALASLKVRACREVALHTFQGASDLAANHRIEK